MENPFAKGECSMSYVASAIVQSETELRSLLGKYQRNTNYYFLRWTHKVSGIQMELAGFPSPEGQLFNAELELRWKQTQQGYYSVLLLSQNVLLDALFEPLPGEWKHEDHEILMHDRRNPQYPNGFSYDPAVQPDRIRQRYFRNVKTLAVQFIALTLQP
jgi:hypothetical protein